MGEKDKVRDALEVLGVAPIVKDVQLAHAEHVLDDIAKNPPNRATRRAVRKAMRKKGSPRRV